MPIEVITVSSLVYGVMSFGAIMGFFCFVFLM